MRLEYLGLSLVEAYERDQRLYACHSLLISLQVDEQVAALAEHSSHAWNQLLPVQYERVCCFFFCSLFLFGRVVNGVFQFRALPAQDYGTDRHPLALFVEVWNNE